MKAVYTEGISQKDYVLATVQAVDKCLTNAKKAHLDSPESLEDQKKSCDIAYDVFDCISDEIGKYCGHTL
nr:unnamed protein product [Callosobruchus analis]